MQWLGLQGSYAHHCTTITMKRTECPLSSLNQGFNKERRKVAEKKEKVSAKSESETKWRVKGLNVEFPTILYCLQQSVPQ